MSQAHGNIILLSGRYYFIHQIATMLKQLLKCAASKEEKIIRPIQEINESANLQGTELLKICLYKVLKS